MSDQTAGSLGGVDLSGDLTTPAPALPAEEAWSPNDEAVAPEVADEAPAVEVPVVDVEPLEVPTPVEEAAVEDAPAPEAPAPKASKVKTKPAPESAASRPYIVLEQVTYDDDTVGFVEVYSIEARNAQVALKNAFKAICAADAAKTDATLVVVPRRMWTPTKVAIQTRHTVSVSA